MGWAITWCAVREEKAEKFLKERPVRSSVGLPRSVVR